ARVHRACARNLGQGPSARSRPSELARFSLYSAPALQSIRNPKEVSMRIAAIILGILGGLLAAMLGVRWLGDASDMRQTIDAMRAAGADTSSIDSLVRGGYCLLLALGLGIAGAVLTIKNNGKLAGVLMIVGAVLPVVFAGAKVLVFTSLLLLGGIFAL